MSHPACAVCGQSFAVHPIVVGTDLHRYTPPEPELVQVLVSDSATHRWFETSIEKRNGHAFTAAIEAKGLRVSLPDYILGKMIMACAHGTCGHRQPTDGTWSRDHWRAW